MTPVPVSASGPHAARAAAGPAVRFADDIPAEDRAEIVDLLRSWDPGLFPGGSAEVRILIGGANNRNYVVECGDARYALRIANPLNERMAVDRPSAVQAQKDAAAGDLAPAVLASRLPEGHVLSTFVEGEVLDPSSVKDERVLELVGDALRRLHRLETRSRSFSPFVDIKQWRRQAAEDGTEPPADLDRLLEWVWKIERVIDSLDLPAVFCHNDTVPQNFIRSGDQIRLVDWDYAGRSLAAFELASFCATADLNEDEQAIVLRAYAGEPHPSQLARIRLLRYVASMREIAWVVMAAPILKGTTTLAEADFYERYLETYLGAARETVEADELPVALALAEQETVSVAW